MPRYDVGESNRVARNDTVRVSSQIPQSTSMGSFIVCKLEGALTRANYSTLLSYHMLHNILILQPCSNPYSLHPLVVSYRSSIAFCRTISLFTLSKYDNRTKPPEKSPFSIESWMLPFANSNVE